MFKNNILGDVMIKYPNKAKEFCIMENNPPLWYNERRVGMHRHEIMFGNNRQKSIEDGLVVFLLPELHNASNKGIHFNREFDLMLKKEAQKRWMEYYNKTEEDFRKRYFRSYL